MTSVIQTDLPGPGAMAVPRSHWHIDREPLPQLPGVEAGGESGTLHRDKSPSLAPPLICAETRQHPLMMPDLLRLIFRFCADDTATLVSCGAVCKTWWQVLVEYASLWQQLAERHIAPVFKAWPAYANGAYRQNSLLLSIAAYHIFSARCFYCGVPTQWYFALHCVRVCRTCFHKRGGPVELCTLSFACDETGLDEDQLSGLCRISLCHGRGLSLPEVEADKPCMLVMRRSACKVAASIRRQSSKVKPVPMVFEEEDEVEEEQPAPVMLQPSPRGAHGARKRRPLSHLRPASWPGHNNAKSTGAITAAKGLELLRDMLGIMTTPLAPARKLTRHVARRTTIVPPAAATTASADDGDAADSDLAIITRPTANILLEHHDMDLSPPHTSATARIARTLNPTPACAEASTTILYNPVGERQADDAVHPLSSLTYHMVLAVPDSPRPTLIRTYASNEAELLDALAAIERTPYSDNCVVTVILTADIELSESLQPRVPLMLQGRYIYVDDDGHGDTADHLRRPRLSISDARVVVVGTNLLTLMDLEVAQHSVRRDGFMCAVQVESQSTLTLVNCLVRASGAAVRARVGAQVALRNCTLFGITSVCVDQPECVTACEDTCMMFYGVWPSQIVGRESMEPWPMLTQAGNMLQYVLPRLGDTLSVWPSSVWESGWALLLVSMAQSAGHLPVEHEEDAAVGLMLRGGDWELQALSDLVLLRLQMGEPTAPADLDEVQRREFLEVLQVVLRKQEVDLVEHGVGVEVDGGGEDDGGDDT